jgi:MoxR-like ATPase
MNTVILSGPQGCGKTRNAVDLQKHFGCGKVVDDWWPGQGLTPGALHLTHEDVQPGNVGAVKLVRWPVAGFVQRAG